MNYPEDNRAEVAALERAIAIVPGASLNITKNRNGYHQISARVRDRNGNTHVLDVRKRKLPVGWSWAPWVSP